MGHKKDRFAQMCEQQRVEMAMRNVHDADDKVVELIEMPGLPPMMTVLVDQNCETVYCYCEVRDITIEFSMSEFIDQFTDALNRFLAGMQIQPIRPGDDFWSHILDQLTLISCQKARTIMEIERRKREGRNGI